MISVLEPETDRVARGAWPKRKESETRYTGEWPRQASLER